MDGRTHYRVQPSGNPRHIEGSEQEESERSPLHQAYPPGVQNQACPPGVQNQQRREERAITASYSSTPSRSQYNAPEGAHRSDWTLRRLAGTR